MDITRVRDRVMKGSVVTVPGVEKDNALVEKQVHVLYFLRQFSRALTEL